MSEQELREGLQKILCGSCIYLRDCCYTSTECPMVNRISQLFADLGYGTVEEGEFPSKHLATIDTTGLSEEEAEEALETQAAYIKAEQDMYGEGWRFFKPLSEELEVKE